MICNYFWATLQSVSEMIIIAEGVDGVYRESWFTQFPVAW